MVIKIIKRYRSNNTSNNIKPYLIHITNKLLKSDTRKVQLTKAGNSISSKNIPEECVMHSKQYDIEIVSHDKVDGVRKELFKSLFSRYQVGLETPKKDSDLIFDCIHLLYSKCHEILIEVDHM